MAQTGYRTVLVKTLSEWMRGEAVANAAITPGHLIYRLSTGKVAVHATSGGEVTPKMVAVENDLAGGEIATAYAAASQVQYIVPRAGDELYMILADGQNAAIGNSLESAGDGTLNVFTADSGAVTEKNEQIVGIALEAIDRSSSSGGDTNVTGRIRVQIV